MKQLVRMQFGSSVYGTRVPTSDTDYRGVFLPSGRDLILQQAPNNGGSKTKLDSNKRNTKDDIDDDRYSLAEFMRMIARGDTGALDMLFTPEEFWVGEVSPIWRELVANRDKLLHKKTASFAGYCQGQAAKYSLKGSNLAAFRLAKDFFSKLPASDKVYYHMEALNKELLDVSKAETIYHEERIPVIKIVMLPEKNGIEAPYLQIGKKTKHGLNVNCKIAADIWTMQFDKYGDRAKLAEDNAGCDWKALMHAVRVCGEAKELLTTHSITMPRPDKELLLQIRNGSLPYAQVADIIVAGLDELTLCMSVSTLPDEVDRDWVEKFIYEAHTHAILDHLLKVAVEEAFK